jgi:hypothetical protein
MLLDNFSHQEDAMHTLKEQLMRWIDEDRAQIIGFLCDFVRAKSPNPLGDTTLAAAHVASFLEAHQRSPRLRRRRGASLTAPLPLERGGRGRQDLRPWGG